MNQPIFTNIETVLISNLHKAQKGLKIAVAWFKNPALFFTILEKQKQGLKIEILLADDNSNFSDAQVLFQELIDGGGIVSIIRHPRLMHHKFCVIDERVLITGSYNWTRNANRNLENIIISTDLLLVNAFLSEFKRINEQSELIKEVSQTTFHISQSTNLHDVDEIENNFAISSITTKLGELPKAENLPINDDIKQLLDQAVTYYLQAKHKEALHLTEKIINTKSDLPDVYHLIATIKWRQKEYKAVVEAASKVIALDNLYYQAYNMLGIGYAGINKASDSLKNYTICIQYDPENYTYHWNSSVSYHELQNSSGIPATLRNQFKRNYEAAVAKTIDLTSQQEANNPSYDLYSTRGQAYLEQKQYRMAKNDLLKALMLYNEAPKNEQDIHVLREIKTALKDAEWFLKQ